VFKVSAPHPRVSVIIPTYNRAGLISQAIDSALRQTFGDHEVIVVDDGSTDETAAVVRAYGDRVRYVWTPNGGAGHARNVGMAHARGDYLTFLDSDDLLYPYALEVSTRLLARFPSVAMVCSEVTGFDDHGFVDRYHMKRYHAPTYRKPGLTYDTIFPSSVQLLETGAIPNELLRDDPTLATRRAYYGNVYDSYLVDIVLFQNSSMVRREVIDALGPRNEQLFCYEELDYLVRLSRASNGGLRNFTARSRYRCCSPTGARRAGIAAAVPLACIWSAAAGLGIEHRDSGWRASLRPRYGGWR